MSYPHIQYGDVISLHQGVSFHEVEHLVSLFCEMLPSQHSYTFSLCDLFFHIHGTSEACNGTCLGDAQLSHIFNNIEAGTRLRLWVFLVPLVGCPLTLVWLLSPMLAAHSPDGALSLNCVQGRFLQRQVFSLLCTISLCGPHTSLIS